MIKVVTFPWKNVLWTKCGQVDLGDSPLFIINFVNLSNHARGDYLSL